MLKYNDKALCEIGDIWWLTDITDYHEICTEICYALQRCIMKHMMPWYMMNHDDLEFETDSSPVSSLTANSVASDGEAAWDMGDIAISRPISYKYRLNIYGCPVIWVGCYSGYGHWMFLGTSLTNLDNAGLFSTGSQPSTSIGFWAPSPDHIP